MTLPPPSSAPARSLQPIDTPITQLSVGPTFAEVAAVLLRDALKNLYPALDIDPNNAMVGEPAWDILDDEIVVRPTRYRSLTDTLIGLAVGEEATVFVEGLHFLTRQPVTIPVVHLPVQIDKIGRLLNELAKVMTIAFQEQLLAFWSAPGTTSEPRWRDLSKTMQNAWDADETTGWSAKECALAKQLFQSPEHQSNPSSDKDAPRAYLIHVDQVDGTEVKHLNETATVVLIGKVDDSEVILAYSVLNGYEKFDSQDALGEAIPNHLNLSSGRKAIEWRLYEPEGNIFDHQACSLIAMQVDAIGALDFSKLSTADDSDQPVNNTPGTGGLTPGNTPGQSWFQQAIPDWLKSASPTDQTLYARYMKDLSALVSSHAGKTYQDDIAPIADYALNALRTQVLKDHPEASNLNLEDIRIQIKSPVVWGLFVVPGKVDTTQFSLVELALQNLIAVPSGIKTLQSHSPLPAWMTVEYIETLVTTVDIGRTYPQLIKDKLIDDSAESNRRSLLYTSQLRLQLPLLALQCCIRKQDGIDKQGYRYVAALMEPESADRKVDGQTIVLRKLAFIPELQLTDAADVVSNMFVIGPEDPAAGPCLLYRPLSDHPLSQYTSPDQLLYAIRQTPSLRTSVLTWLPDGVREDYARLAFPGPIPSPWAVVEYLTDTVKTLKMSGPIKLGRETVEGDFLAALFKANADALVTLADSQSVSNSESRWETLKHAGWLILSAALPFLGRTAGIAMWIWQVMDDLEQIATDDQKSDSKTKWSAFVDLLLNLGMAITSHAISRHQQSGSSRRATAPKSQVTQTPPKPSIKKLPPLSTAERASDQHQPMRTVAALASTRQSLGSLLATLSVDKPDGLGKPVAEGARKGLYQQGTQWYAEVANKWFNVSVAGDDVFIFNTEKSISSDLPLIGNVAGTWYVDLRLRLRGGGIKSSRQKVQLESDSSTASLRDELIAFELLKSEKQKALQKAYKEMTDAPSTSKEAKRKLFQQTLSSQRKSYDEALETLIKWSEVGPVPDFGQCKLGYLKAQMDFTLADLSERIPSFTSALNKSLEQIEQTVDTVEQQHVDDAEQMITMSEEMIERLDYMHTRFTALKTLGPEGLELTREARGKLPAYQSDDLRLTQLDMYRHLCLSLDTLQTVPEGWTTLNQLMDIAAVAFQSLRDAINERSVIRLDEQIESLSSLTEQFTVLNERLTDFEREYNTNVRPNHLTRLRSKIGDLKKRAVKHLILAVDERDALRLKSPPYEPRPLPQRKIIRALHWGVISGEPRLSDTGEETDRVDLKRPYSDKLIVSFHRKENGTWAPNERSTVLSKIVPTLSSSMTTGNALIEGLTAFNEHVTQLVQNPDRTPTGIELLMRQHARRLTHISSEITKASRQTTSTPGEERLATSLSTQLSNAAKTLQQSATDTMLGMIKKRPPTVESIEWLKSRNHISIKKTVKRRKVKDSTDDFLDRYEIHDLANKKIVLWYADFHYPTSWRADHAYLSARLRTPEQIKSGDRVDDPAALNEHQMIDFYRSEIAVDQAKELFFPPRP